MQKPRYADPSVIAVNKEDGHAIAMPYDTAAQALAGENSPYKQSLTGLWKFSWCRGVKNELEGFEAPGNSRALRVSDPGLFRALLLCQHISQSVQPQQGQDSKN